MFGWRDSLLPYYFLFVLFFTMIQEIWVTLFWNSLCSKRSCLIVQLQFNFRFVISISCLISDLVLVRHFLAQSVTIIFLLIQTVVIASLIHQNLFICVRVFTQFCITGTSTKQLSFYFFSFRLFFQWFKICIFRRTTFFTIPENGCVQVKHQLAASIIPQ